MNTLDTSKQEPFTLEDYRVKVLENSTHVVGTKDGYPVRIGLTDAKLENNPIVGCYEFQDGRESLATWNAYGVSQSHLGYNLFLYPKPPESLGWVVAYQSEHSSGVRFPIHPYPTVDELRIAFGAFKWLSEPIQVFAKTSTEN